MANVVTMPHNFEAERSFLGALILGENSHRAAAPPTRAPRIAQLSGLRRTTVQRALERLIAQGRVVRTKKGISRRPFRYWAKQG